MWVCATVCDCVCMLGFAALGASFPAPSMAQGRHCVWVCRWGGGSDRRGMDQASGSVLLIPGGSTRQPATRPPLSNPSIHPSIHPSNPDTENTKPLNPALIVHQTTPPTTIPTPFTTPQGRVSLSVRPSIHPITPPTPTDPPSTPQPRTIQFPSNPYTDKQTHHPSTPLYRAASPTSRRPSCASTTWSGSRRTRRRHVLVSSFFGGRVVECMPCHLPCPILPSFSLLLRACLPPPSSLSVSGTAPSATRAQTPTHIHTRTQRGASPRCPCPRRDWIRENKLTRPLLLTHPHTHHHNNNTNRRPSSPLTYLFTHTPNTLLPPLLLPTTTTPPTGGLHPLRLALGHLARRGGRQDHHPHPHGQQLRAPRALLRAARRAAQHLSGIL